MYCSLGVKSKTECAHLWGCCKKCEVYNQCNSSQKCLNDYNKCKCNEATQKTANEKYIGRWGK